MKITRRSIFSGKEHTMDLPVTQDQMDRYERREGYVQDLFPLLTADEREFIKTGVTPEEWAESFGEKS